MFAGKAIRCGCGYEVRPSDEDALVEEIRRHASEAHGIAFSAELARGATQAPSDDGISGKEGREMHKRLVVLGLALVLGTAAVAAFATVPQAVASTDASACPGAGPLVVNVYGTYRNAADFGPDGHVWALDAARESIQIWRIGTNTYCLKRQDIGTFTTFAGVSPEGTGTVRAGVTGRWYGEILAVIHGTFAPTVATTGFRGDFDLQCGQDGTCLGPAFNARPYFSQPIDSVQFLTFSGTFEAGACGVWRQDALTGADTGDIVC